MHFSDIRNRDWNGNIDKRIERNRKKIRQHSKANTGNSLQQTFSNPFLIFFLISRKQNHWIWIQEHVYRKWFALLSLKDFTRKQEIPTIALLRHNFKSLVLWGRLNILQFHLFAPLEEIRKLLLYANHVSLCVYFMFLFGALYSWNMTMQNVIFEPTDCDGKILLSKLFTIWTCEAVLLSSRFWRFQDALKHGLLPRVEI